MLLHLALGVLSSGMHTCSQTSGNGNVAYTVSQPPTTVSIMTPAPGPVTGTTSLTASCTQQGCAKVCYYADGVLISSTCPTSAPYKFLWDSTKVIDGPHSLAAVGFNAAGLTNSSAALAITATNGVLAKNYYFDGDGGFDGNDCLSQTSACRTLAHLASLTLLGGDHVWLKAGSHFSTPATYWLCGPGAAGTCMQNFYPSGATTYGGGACNPFASTDTTPPANCAQLVRTGTNSASGMRLVNVSNVVIQNIAFMGTAATATNSLLIAMDNNTTLNGLGRSDNVTIQNNYVNNWDGIGANFAYLANKLFPGYTQGLTTNFQVLDNVVTAPYGAAGSPDTGIVIGPHTCAQPQQRQRWPLRPVFAQQRQGDLAIQRTIQAAMLESRRRAGQPGDQQHRLPVG